MNLVVSELLGVPLCLGSYDSEILLSELLGVKLSLGVAGVGGEPAPSSTPGTGTNQKKPVPLAWQGFLYPCFPGVPVTPGIGAAVVASFVILGVSDLLGDRIPLCVVGVGGEPEP